MKRSLALIFCLVPFFLFAQDGKTVQLPGPDTKGGKPLQEVLSLRKSSREFSNKELPLQVLSDLLWAANGVNRKEGNYRTAPSTMNMQEIDIYVARADGLYLYDAVKHSLLFVLKDDIRAVTGKQEFAAFAPVNLIFVADLDKMGKVEAKDRDGYAGMDASFISENVYLFCASEGLGTVVRGWLDKDLLAKAMKLKSTQKVILAQTVGYPK